MPIVVAGASWAIVVLVVAITGFATIPALGAITSLTAEFAATGTRAVAWRAAGTTETATFTAFAIAWWVGWTIGAAWATEAPAAFLTVARSWTVATAGACS